MLGFDPYHYTGTPGRQRLMRELEKSLGAAVTLEPADEYDPPRVAAFARADGARAAVLLINAETTPCAAFDVRFRGSAKSALAIDLSSAETPLAARAEDGVVSAWIGSMSPWETLLVLFE